MCLYSIICISYMYEKYSMKGDYIIIFRQNKSLNKENKD